jgi:ribosomal protein S18 acetylase RimI-like enzyme
MYARSKGIDRIILHTTSKNMAAITLFKKAGYMVAENAGDRLKMIKKVRFG